MKRWKPFVAGVASVLGVQGLILAWTLYRPVSVVVPQRALLGVLAKMQAKRPLVGDALSQRLVAALDPMVRAELAPVVNHVAINVEGVPVSLDARSRAQLVARLSTVLETQLTSDLAKTPLKEALPNPLVLTLWQRAEGIPIPLDVGPWTVRVIVRQH